jgi:hypothetical protein
LHTPTATAPIEADVPPGVALREHRASRNGPKSIEGLRAEYFAVFGAGFVPYIEVGGGFDSTTDCKGVGSG